MPSHEPSLPGSTPQGLERTLAPADQRRLEAATRVGQYRLHPPQQLVHLVHRPALLGGLDEALQRRLVLLQAPAGYGKTTLLAQWWNSLASRGVKAAWLTLDEDSRIAAEFLTYVIHAVAVVGLDVGELAAATLQSVETPAPRIALNALLYELDRVEGPVVLILDDYHLAQSGETDDLLDMFIRRMPENIHVVVASRLRPGVTLPALRAQGQVREFGAEQLRFSLNEAFDLLRPHVRDEDITTLAARTEGWPIALQLAGLWARDHQDAGGLLQTFSGSIDDMADYLATQVFAGLPEHLQTFLLETAIFDQFSSEVADATRGASDSALLMEELKRLNVLLIPIDRERVWFRHHHLVSEFLASRGSQLGEARQQALQHSASVWFESRGSLLEAVRHARAGGDRKRAVRLVEEAGCVRLCLQEGISRAQSLFALLRPAEIDASARIRLARALVLLKEGKLQAGDKELEDVRRMADPRLDGVDWEAFRRDLVIVETLRACYGDTQLAADDYEALDAMSAANRETDPWLSGLLNNLLCLLFLRRGDIGGAELSVHKALGYYRDSANPYGCLFMNIHLATISLAHGHLSEAANALHVAEELTFSQFGGNTSLLAIAQTLMAEVAYERNNVTRATELLNENLAIIATSEGWAEIYASGYGTAALLSSARGDVAGAERALDRAMELMLARGLPRVGRFLMARRAAILNRAGRPQEAREWLAQAEQGDFPGTNVSWVEADEISIARARIALADGATSAALDTLESLAADAGAQGHLRSVLRADALRALALRALERPEDAATVLIGVLDRARGEGYKRLFIDEGPQMAELLRDAVRRKGATNVSSATLDYVTELLASFGELTRSDERARLLSALTPREREILRELSRSVANKVIARSLDLNENAVKFHLKNIYRKLGVVSRTMAVTVAEKLELL
jgi:LuxR family maltose regulon positive regulatory protein